MDRDRLIAGLEIDDAEAERMIERAARAVVRAKMDLPAAVALEVVRPLVFLGGQMLTVLVPFLYPLFGKERVDRFTALAGDRRWVRRLAERIEELADSGLDEDGGPENPVDKPEEESKCTPPTQ